MVKDTKMEGDGKRAPPRQSVRPPRPVQGRALNRWDPEAERDLIMACLTSENNNYPTINWPRVKSIMDTLGYKFSRSALDQRWSKKIMKEWRDRHQGSTDTDFADPATANQTPGRKRGRVNAATRARATASAAGLATRALGEGLPDDEQEDDDDDYELHEKKPAAKRARTAQPKGGPPKYQGRDVVVIGDDEDNAVESVSSQPAQDRKVKVTAKMPRATTPGKSLGLKQSKPEDSKSAVVLANAPTHRSYPGTQYTGLTPYNPVPVGPVQNRLAGIPQQPNAYNSPQAPASLFGGAQLRQSIENNAANNNVKNEDNDVIFKRARSVTLCPKPEGM